jgi:hypothetical protein
VLRLRATLVQAALVKKVDEHIVRCLESIMPHWLRC